jgi:hypothetical protein
MLVLCLAGVVGLSAPALADPGLSAPETPSLALILSEAPLPDLSAVSPALDLLGDDAISRTCCKICRKGKACGDSCINRAYTCHRPPGCACDG